MNDLEKYLSQQGNNNAGKLSQFITWAEVNDYDPKTNTVSLRIMGTNLNKETGISFTSPYSDNCSGLMGVPTKGTLAIVATTLNRDYVVLAFIQKNTESLINEGLMAGDIMMQSMGGSFIKEDAEGNVHIGTQGNAVLTITKTGELIQFSNTSLIETAVSRIEEKLVNNKPYLRRDVFSDIPKMQYNGVEELASRVLRGETVIPANRSILVTEEIGEIVDGDNIRLKSPALSNVVFKLTVGNSYISFDEAGNVHVKATGKIINMV